MQPLLCSQVPSRTFRLHDKIAAGGGNGTYRGIEHQHMILTHFATALEAQSAFYTAFQNADLAQMMAVWAEEEDIVCIHPGGTRHTGIEEVRESWRQIFSGGPELRFELVAAREIPGRMTSIHSVYERITASTDPTSPTSVVATNIFALTDRGWQMLVHHASQVPDQPARQNALPSLLH